MLLSPVQQSNSAVHMCASVSLSVCIHSLFFKFSYCLGRNSALRAVPCITQIVLISYQGIITQNIQTSQIDTYQKRN